MTDPSSSVPDKRKRTPHSQVEISSLLDLLEQQDGELRSLFATALNLHVSPGADAVPDREKHDRLKQAIEASLNRKGDSC